MTGRKALNTSADQSPNSSAAETRAWNWRLRIVVFALASTSIACLIGHFYGLFTMRVAVPVVMMPAFVLLGMILLRNRRTANQIVSLRLTQGIMAGLAACIAYDVFRLPFVIMKAAGVESSFALPLFKK